MLRNIVFIVLFLLLPGVSCGQADSFTWLPTPPPHYNFVKYEDNYISGHGQLDSFLHKLVILKHTHKGNVNIIHIGDSHLQADGITSVLRNGFHDFFGDAGRGLVFPYQLANSNAPHDIQAKSNITWKNNRLTSLNKPVTTGIAGFGIQSPANNAAIDIKLKEIDGHQEHFNRMVFFLCNDSVCYKVTDSTLTTSVMFNTPTRKNAPPVVVNSDSLLTGFEIKRVGGGDEGDHSFYGVSLERSDVEGVLYHTIGVNGARYDQYLASDLFWSQLSALKGDLFIISLGTNEAQNPYINEQNIMGICDSFVKKIHKIAPAAAVLITTPCGSYYRMKKPNKGIQGVTLAMLKYCENKSIPCWDLFDIADGMAGIPMLKKYDLLSHDLVHYNNAGYQLQGLLLLDAFAKEYNKYEKRHPWKPTAKVATARPKQEMPVTKTKVVETEIMKAKIQTVKKPTADSLLTNPPKPAKVPVPMPAEHKTNIKVEYEN